ncbi:MAG: AAA family ATPase [Sulfurimonas sp.]|jgi:nucleoside-triphosphatase THEP1
MHEEALNEFINSLEINEEHLPKKGLKLQTLAQNKIFYVYKDSQNEFYARPEARPNNEKGWEKKNMVTRFLNNSPTENDKNDSYGEPIYKYVKENFIDNNQLVQDVEITEKKYSNSVVKNIILYGAPGVGKTHNYKNLISMIEEGNNQKEIFDTIAQNRHVELENETYEGIKKEKRVEFVTFHQSYSYEDFIEGFRPNESGNIELEDGIFKRFCSEALKKNEQNFYIVIDEINRGNISKIFGELITLIEEDKRDVYEVTLPYSKEKFKVPSNLYIIATMNSTDKSIATIDIALRRRFTFLKMKPNEELVIFSHAKELLNKLNIFIAENLNEDYKLGHSYFMNVANDEDLEFVKEYKIKPLLEEYFYVDKDKLGEALNILKIEK